MDLAWDTRRKTYRLFLLSDGSQEEMHQQVLLQDVTMKTVKSKNMKI